MTLIWPQRTLIDLQTSKIVSMTITKKIGMLHIKRKLKTAVLQRKLSTSEHHVAYFLLFWIIWPLMTLNWPLMTLIDLQTSIIVRITITKKIGMLHIKRKLKTAVLQRKYGQVSLRSKVRPQADLHWPLMTSKLSVLKHIHDVYQKSSAPQDIICDKLFAVLDHMTSHDSELTSNDHNWPPDLNNSKH